jgi:hypothetical protein
MTDDPSSTPGDLEDEAASEDAADVAAVAAPEDVEPDEAQDLDDAELEAAAERAKLEVDAEDEGLDVENLDGIEAAPILAPGAPQIEPSVRGPRARGPKPAEHVAFAIDPGLRIRDPWSSAFVIATLAVFGVILAYALLFGHGGAFTPIATPSPVPTAGEVTPAPSDTTAPSGSIAPTPSPAPTEPPPTPVR